MPEFLHPSGRFLAGFMFGLLAITATADAQHIAAGRIHSMYLAPDGNVWVWGGGGTKETKNKLIPQLAMTNAKAVFANADENLSFVLKKDESLWGWGVTERGQLGIISGRNHKSPAYLATPRQVTRNVTVVTGPETIFALKPDHTLWAWGGMGEERGDTVKKNVTRPVKKMTDVAQVSSTNFHTLALKTDGTLLAWGDNACGALGIGNTKTHVKPVKVNVKPLGKRKIVKIATRNGESFAIADDGSVWSWGERNILQPFCRNEPRLVPTRLPNIDNVRDIALGYSSEIYLKKDGTVWGWEVGRLRSEFFDEWYRPYKIMDHAREIAAGEGHYIVLKDDGTVWTWGQNRFGQLGNGTKEPVWEPAEVHFPTPSAYESLKQVENRTD